MEKFSSAEKIAYLGPKGSYTEIATDIFYKKFNLNAELQAQHTNRNVIEFVDKNKYSLGVIPVENSIEGAVREAVDALIKTQNTNIKFLAETVIPINHCLLSKNDDISKISSIISHPQALGQCQNFIHQKFPQNLNTIKTSSTSEAARSLTNYDETYAAIGNKKTAELYNLTILQENINDDKSNQTRFALIGDFETIPTNSDKTSLAFSTANKPGALLTILNIFNAFDINLTYIDSRPSKTKLGEYTFFVDFDGHINDDKVKFATEKVIKESQYYRFIGSYQKL